MDLLWTYYGLVPNKTRIQSGFNPLELFIRNLRCRKGNYSGIRLADSSSATHRYSFINKICCYKIRNPAQPSHNKIRVGGIFGHSC